MSHKPVLINEVIAAINNLKPGYYVDSTFGAGGYTKELLRQNNNAIVIGIDRDINSKKYASEIEKEFPNRFLFVNDVFSNIKNILKNLNISKINGIMYDFGVSSMQLDTSERGFSFSKESPLSMQMGLNNLSAYDVINKYSESELANLIYKNADERYSRKIASNIIKYRKNKQITTTTELASIIINSVPKIPSYKQTIHPATRTFQAIRIEVNNEFTEIQKSILDCVDFLESGSAIACVSFHWIEDKIVKNLFKELSGKSTNPNRHEQGQANDTKNLSILTIMNKNPITPSKEELEENPRSRSALLRIGNKI